MILQKDLEDRIKALEQFAEVKKNEYLKALGRIEEQNELLGLMVAQQKKLAADAAEAEKKAKEEENAKGSQEGLAEKPKKRSRKVSAPVEGVECIDEVPAEDGMAVQD